MTNRFRGLSVGKESRNNDSDDFESVLEVDEDGNFFSISQFDNYVWRSSPVSHISFYEYGVSRKMKLRNVMIASKTLLKSERAYRAILLKEVDANFQKL